MSDKAPMKQLAQTAVKIYSFWPRLLKLIITIVVMCVIGAGATFVLVISGSAGGASSVEQHEQELQQASSCGVGQTAPATVQFAANTVPAAYTSILAQAANSQGIDPYALATVLWLANKGYPNPPAPYGSGTAWPSTGRGAAGPYQLLPGAWDAYGVDANQDGKADVNNLADASFGAAAYLKALGALADASFGDPKQPNQMPTIVNAIGVFYAGSNANLSSPSMQTLLASAVQHYKSLKGTAPKDVPIEQEIAQSFIVGFDASTPKAVITAVAQLHVGGFFVKSTHDAVADGFNKAFFDSLVQPGDPPLNIAVDNEGGQVQVVATPQTFPSAKAMGKMDGVTIQNTAEMVSKALKANGYTMDLGPVLDVDSSRSASSGDIIGGVERSFSTDPQQVAHDAMAFAGGLVDNGIVPVFKHFPGLGFATGSHANNTDVATAQSPPLSVLKTRDLIPYQQALASYTNAVVMMSNETVTGLDDTNPASISPSAVQLLRNTDKFAGAITTDDLNVPSVIEVAGDLPTAVAKAFAAGADLPLFSGLSSDPTTAVAQVQAVIAKVKAMVSPQVIYAAYMEAASIRPGGAAAPTNVTVTPAQPLPSSSLCCTPAALISAANAVDITSTGVNNADVAWQYLIANKYTPIGASGMIGSFIGESGVEPERQESVFDHLVSYKDLPSGPQDHHGWGIVQWTPWTKFIEPALAAGKDPNDFGVQLDWLINHDPQFTAGIKQQLAAATSPADASDIFFSKFEQAGDSSGPVRQRYAQSIYDWKVKGTPLPSDIAREISKSAVKTAASPAAAVGAAAPQSKVAAPAPAQVVARVGAPAVAAAVATPVVGLNCGTAGGIVNAAYSTTGSGGGKGCTTGETILPVPAGGIGTPVCYFNQGSILSSTYDWGMNGCMPSSVTIITATLTNNGKLDPNAVQQAVQADGGLDGGGGGIYTGALKYFADQKFQVVTIDDHPSSGNHHPVTAADMAQVDKYLSQGYVIFTHTSTSVDSAGTHGTSGHFLTLYAKDASDNYYVGNPGARADNNVPVSAARIMQWLDMFIAVK